MAPAIIVDDLEFTWPNGEPLFTGLSFAVTAGRTGLIGLNGCGKSTLLRLIAGDLPRGRGSIRVAGSPGYLRQDLTLSADLRVDEVLGIAGARRALHAIEDGTATADHFTALGDDWDVEERALATLDRLGMPHLDLPRRVGEISGGETVLLGLAAQFLRRPDVLLLDEPTNNLDLRARRRLYDAMLDFSGVLVVVSHDRALLELVDQIADLREGTLTFYGGNLDAYEQAVAAAQETAQRVVRTARAEVRRERRDLIEARTRLERSQRYGRKLAEQARFPPIVANGMKRKAQVTAGRVRGVHEERLEQARDRLVQAQEAVHDDDHIRVDLPETQVPGRRAVLSVTDAVLRCGARIDLDVRGPERIALLGANGAGKTTLLETIAGLLSPVDGQVRPAVPLRYLPQRLDLLDGTASLLDNVRRFAPSATPYEIRSKLARFLFRGARADQLAGTLSGGELFRATLAALLLARPAPQLLLLDEPTNNLDMAQGRPHGEVPA